jgi:signal transduction histidine kinase
LLGAVAAERETFAEEVRRSRARLVEAADAERRRIERDLHDGAQHRLISLAGKLRRAREPGSEGLLEEVEADLLLAIDELRELAQGVRPSTLADFGLAGAIKSIAARSMVPIRMLDLPAGRLNETAETTAYYVVAEAVTNVCKHAHASFISVRLWMSHGMLFVEVDDDGVGGAAETEGSGLQGLRDRVEAVDGTFFVLDAAPHGTRVAAVIPAVEGRSTGFDHMG